MISDRKKRQVTSQYQKLNKDIDTIKNKALENISKELFEIFNDIDKITQTTIDHKIDKIVNLTYQYLEDVYTKVSTDVKQIFNNATDDVTEIHPYDKDGKTLDDRITEYINQWVDILRASPKNDPAEVKEASVLTIDRILSNEGSILKNQIIFNKTRKLAEFMTIEGIGECGTEGMCSEHFGTWSVDDMPDLPPYHPYCQCMFFPDITDEPDEIEELDLDDEAIKEPAVE